MKEIDVLVIGELNVDLIFNGLASAPETGKEILADEMLLTMGSSSAIFACNLSVLGTKVAFSGLVGQDVFGKMIMEGLKQKKVDTSMVISTDEHATGATVVMNDMKEDRAMITCQGAMKNYHSGMIPFDRFSSARHLHISSLFIQPGIRDHLKKIFSKAKTAGLTTSLDIQWDPEEKWGFDFRNILPYVDVFLPNEKEILALTKTENIRQAIQIIGDRSKLVAIKAGNKGSFLWAGNKLTHKNPFINKNVTDATGAGDSFNAGFIHKFIRGDDPEKCQVFGNLMGAISTTATGGTGAFSDLASVMEIARSTFNYK